LHGLLHALPLQPTLPDLLLTTLSWCWPSGKEVEETLLVVDKETKEAAAQKQVVQGEEAVAAEKAAAAKAIKVSCQQWVDWKRYMCALSLYHSCGLCGCCRAHLRKR
jgi:hypothetical protein